MTPASRLIVASNRGPVRWEPGPEGDLRPARGFGGLVTALGGAMQHEPGTWVSVALSDEDAQIAAQHQGEAFDVSADDSRFTLRLLDVGDRLDPYYNEVANRLLWFTVHALWGEPYEPAGHGWQEPWEAYCSVNRELADAVVEAAGSGGEVFLQDYHLCTAPRRVREALPDVPVLHYVHTPWVGPGEYLRLPDPIAHGVLEGLLAADVVAFSSAMWCRAFMRCAEDLMGVTRDGDTLLHEGGRTVVLDFVLGVDPAALDASAATPEARERGEEIDERLDGRKLLLRVDRTDLSKNILRGLWAYERLLEDHPEHRDQVCHVANLNPSRQSVPEYRRYVEACQEVAERIATRFGDEVIHFQVGDDYPGVVAALQRYDVLLCNPVIDGTNLVAKEGPALNTRDGVLVLSRSAGAAGIMGDAALLVNPYDVEETAVALHRGLSMDADERADRAEHLRAQALRGGPTEWLQAQRAALSAAVARRRM